MTGGAPHLPAVPDKIPVVARPRALRDDTVLAWAPAGSTVAEIVGGELRRTIVLIDGEAVPAESWHVVRPAAGQQVTVLGGVPQDDALGGGTLRSIMMIGVFVAAAAVSSGALGPAGLGILGEAFAAGTFGASLLGAGVGRVAPLTLCRMEAP